MSTAEEKIGAVRDTLSTIIHLVDSREAGTTPEVTLEMIRTEAVACLDRIREEG